MIILKINNASEIVASKLGKFLEKLTPDSIDQAAVENELIKQLLRNLQSEGVKGELAAVSGLDLTDGDLRLHDQLRVRKHHTF
ncbi:MAG: hypothetical protein VKK98_06950 [Cyanobacteriota bacterium]|nr:hypothetical protein [Cyanobacteriota bacterium]